MLFRSHWVMNALAVLAAAQALGADVAHAARTLATLEPLAGRGRITEAGTDAARFTLIDESYNANPASMRAAIELLGRLTPGAGARRTVRTASIAAGQPTKPAAAAYSSP